ncbi:MAG: NAD(P)H-dependent oxidoreductase [Variovorax sp.]|nr:NAD(P)H-dependent oxidoreductase [Variovorax sp.]
MSTPPRILAFAGSSRESSLNRRLVRLGAQAARTAGAEVTLIDLGDYPLPIYDGDIEGRDGLPENVGKLKALFHAHDGLLIASPENNASVSALLKNALDWVSRPAGGPAGMVKLNGKVAAMMVATPGALGGLRGLVALRAILQTLGALTLAEQFSLPRADQAFAEDGSLKDPTIRTALDQLVGKLVHVAGRLA